MISPMPMIAAVSGICLNQKTQTIVTKKPNIVIIWGDDIGQSNLSCYTREPFGYQDKTPGIAENFG